MTQFHVRATGSEQVPPISSKTVAAVQLAYNGATRQLDHAIALAGLTASDVLSVDLHRWPAGSRGPIVLVLVDANGSTLSGRTNLSATDAADLLEGRLYFDVHTRPHVAGEVRAQLEVR